MPMPIGWPMRRCVAPAFHFKVRFISAVENIELSVEALSSRGLKNRRALTHAAGTMGM